MKCLKKLVPLAVATSIAVPALFASMAVEAGALSGNIGIHSKYLLRGIGEEAADGAVQGGLDYDMGNGFSLGWWASNLGYSYSGGASNSDGTGFENDFYGAYSGQIGELGYSVGFIQYVYLNVDDSNLTEITGGISYGPFTAGFQTLVNDGWWGNSGDTYWKLGYSTELPKGIGFAADLGYYTYDDDDNENLGGCNNTTPCTVTTDDSGFRHLNLTFSHAVGSTGADAYVQYTFAGDDRTGSSTDYDDKIVLGITYGFDL